MVAGLFSLGSGFNETMGRYTASVEGSISRRRRFAWMALIRVALRCCSVWMATRSSHIPAGSGRRSVSGYCWV